MNSLVGLAVNPEFFYEGESTEGSEKGYLKSFKFYLSGSSTNVAICLSNFGQNPTLLVPDEVENTPNSDILDSLLRRLDMASRRLRILDKGSMAVYPYSEKRKRGEPLLYGEKGVLTRRHNVIEHARDAINRENGVWRIATGVNKSFADLAGCLLGEKEGYRVFSPHNTLCSDFHSKDVLIALLRKADMLMLNEQELKQLRATLDCPISKIMNELGIKLFIITEEDKGGIVFMRNKVTKRRIVRRFDAYPVPKGKKIYSVGAGDWALGAFMASMMSHGKNFLEVNFDEVKQMIDFAAKVASLKITMQGGANGPSQDMVAKLT